MDYHTYHDPVRTCTCENCALLTFTSWSHVWAEGCCCAICRGDVKEPYLKGVQLWPHPECRGDSLDGVLQDLEQACVRPESLAFWAGCVKEFRSLRGLDADSLTAEQVAHLAHWYILGVECWDRTSQDWDGQGHFILPGGVLLVRGVRASGRPGKIVPGRLEWVIRTEEEWEKMNRKQTKPAQSPLPTPLPTHPVDRMAVQLARRDHYTRLSRLSPPTVSGWDHSDPDPNWRKETNRLTRLAQSIRVYGSREDLTPRGLIRYDQERARLDAGGE